MLKNIFACGIFPGQCLPVGFDLLGTIEFSFMNKLGSRESFVSFR